MMYGGAGTGPVQGLCFDADCNPGNAFLEYMDTNFPDSGFAFMFCIHHFTQPDSHLCITQFLSRPSKDNFLFPECDKVKLRSKRVTNTFPSKLLQKFTVVLDFETIIFMC